MQLAKKIIIVCAFLLAILIVLFLTHYFIEFRIMLISTANETVNNENTNIAQNNTVNEIAEESEIKKELQIYDIDDGYLTVPYNNNATKHNYNWDNLSSNGYYSYSDEKYVTKFGIDVSEFQGDINWEKVKNAGIEFAFIRLGFRGYAGSGNLVLDTKFEQNVNNATKNGVKVGIYFFSQAITVNEAKEEASYVLEHIKDKSISYPICFDLEKIRYDTARTDNLTQEEITNITLAFRKEIENAGYSFLVYGNSKTFTTRMQLEKLNDCNKWYADYLDTPFYPYDFTFWQYSESGKVDGISGNVDLDLYFVEK